MNAMNRFAMDQGYNVTQQVKKVTEQVVPTYSSAPFKTGIPEQDPIRPYPTDIDFVPFSIPGCITTVPLMVPEELEFSNDDYVMLNRMNLFIDQYFSINGFPFANPVAYLSGFNDCRNFLVVTKVAPGINIPSIAFSMTNAVITVAVDV